MIFTQINAVKSARIILFVINHLLHIVLNVSLPYNRQYKYCVCTMLVQHRNGRTQHISRVWQPWWLWYGWDNLCICSQRKGWAVSVCIWRLCMQSALYVICVDRGIYWDLIFVFVTCHLACWTRRPSKLDQVPGFGYACQSCSTTLMWICTRVSGSKSSHVPSTSNWVFAQTHRILCNRSPHTSLISKSRSIFDSTHYLLLDAPV